MQKRQRGDLASANFRRVWMPSREFIGARENDYAMITLARNISIDVAAVQLVDIDAIWKLA